MYVPTVVLYLAFEDEHKWVKSRNSSRFFFILASLCSISWQGKSFLPIWLILHGSEWDLNWSFSIFDRSTTITWCCCCPLPPPSPKVKGEWKLHHPCSQCPCTSCMLHWIFSNSPERKFPRRNFVSLCLFIFWRENLSRFFPIYHESWCCPEDLKEDSWQKINHVPNSPCKSAFRLQKFRWDDFIDSCPKGIYSY